MKKIFNKERISLDGLIVEFTGHYEDWVGKTHPTRVPVASSIEDIKRELGEINFPCFLNIKRNSSDYFGWVHYMYWCTPAPDVCIDDTIEVSSYEGILEALDGLENKLCYQTDNTERYEALKGVIHDPFSWKKIGEVDYKYDLTDVNFPARFTLEGNIDPDGVINGLIKRGLLNEDEVA